MSQLIGQEVSAAALVRGDRGRVMRLVLEGELGRDDMAAVGDMLFRLSSDGVVNVVLDLAQVTHFDFRGVRPLMRRAEVLRSLGGDLRLSGLSPYLFAIFRSAGANDAFDYFGELEQAVASFHPRATQPPR